MKHEELMHFFDVLTTLREEYAKSSHSLKVEKISSLAQVAVEVIKCGKIPYSFQLEHSAPYNPNLLIEPVKELFNRLSLHIEVGKPYERFTPSGRICYVVFITKQ